MNETMITVYVELIKAGRGIFPACRLFLRQDVVKVLEPTTSEAYTDWEGSYYVAAT